MLISIPMNCDSEVEHNDRSSRVIKEVFPLPHSPCNAIVIGAEEFSMNFINPYTTQEVAAGIVEYMKRYNIADINEIIGTVS